MTKMRIYKGTNAKRTFTIERDGAGVNLTAATVVLNIEPAEGGANLITDGACVLEDAANGVVSYTPVGASLFVTEGKFTGQFKWTIAGDDDFSDTFEIDVLEVI